MRIGIIGTGQVGSTLARKLGQVGHTAKLANSRGTASVSAIASEVGTAAVSVADAAKDVEVVRLDSRDARRASSQVSVRATGRILTLHRTKNLAMNSKRVIRLAILSAFIWTNLVGALVRADTNADIAAALMLYEQALGSGDVNAMMRTFADNPVVLLPGKPTAVGREAVRSSYEEQFLAIRFSITFKIDEVQELSENWAFARTHSDGSKVVRATGATLPGGNQELFILSRNEAGVWKIARYAFSVARSGN